MEGGDQSPHSKVRDTKPVIPNESPFMRFLVSLSLSFSLVLFATSVPAQILQYPIPHLESVYPAGGARGETVAIELRGQDGVTGGVTVIVDGPPGEIGRAHV